MKFRRNNGIEERLLRLARKIESSARRDDERILEMQKIAARRALAAAELHAACASFVHSVNKLLPKPMLELSPPDFTAASFREPGPNVYQLAVSGRIVHLEFRATDTLMSTEKFRIPYILEGAVRTFNQELLDMPAVAERLLFCCLEGSEANWLWFDVRTRRAEPLDQDHLIDLLEPLL